MSEGTERYRLLAMSERRAEVEDWLERWPAMSWREFRKLVRTWVRPGKMFSYFLAVASQSEAAGVQKPASVPKLDVQIAASIQETVWSLDDLSRVGALKLRLDSTLPTWGHYNPTILTSSLREGAFVIVTGLPRMGKTGFACKLMEDWRNEEKNGWIISNIELDPAPPNYRYVTCSRELFLAIADCLDAKAPFVWALDDAALARVQRMDTITTRAKAVGLVWRDIGKMRGRVIYIEQLDIAVPTIIERFSRLMVVCETPGVMSVEALTPQGDHKWSIHVQGFPRTTLGYETRQWAVFDAQDIDIGALLDFTAGREDTSTAIREYLAKATSQGKKPKTVPVRNEHGQIVRWEQEPLTTTTT